MSICANPICRTPFRKKTLTQKYCDHCTKVKSKPYIDTTSTDNKETNK